VPQRRAESGPTGRDPPHGTFLQLSSDATQPPGADHVVRIRTLVHSWSLIKASAGVLSRDKELLVFPLLSSICSLVVVATFVLPMMGMGLLDGLHQDSAGIPIALYALAFVFYLIQYFVIFFFNSALVGAAMIRLDGGDPTVGDGLGIAFRKVVPILGYAAIAATVGLILRSLQERAGFLGRIVVGLLGVAWTVATFLVVPVLVTRDVGPIDALKESAELLKKTWGENLIGQGGVGVAFGLIYALLAVGGFAVVFFVVTLTRNMTLVAIAVAVIAFAFILAALIHAALSGIYSAALYRYATAQDTPAGFDARLLERSFAVK